MFKVTLCLYGKQEKGLTAVDTIRRLGLTADATALRSADSQAPIRQFEVPESFARRHAKLFQEHERVDVYLGFADLDAGDCFEVKTVSGPNGDIVCVGLAELSAERAMHLAERVMPRKTAEGDSARCIPC